MGRMPLTLDQASPPVVAVVLAGGAGSRFGGEVPKQLVDLAGRPILFHALKAFDDAELTMHVVIPANPAWFAEIKAVAEAALQSVEFTIVDGGDARNSSVHNALNEVSFEEAKILLHDGVRPLVSRELITRVSDGLDEFECVIPVVPSIDPVVQVHRGMVERFLPRSETMRGQSPQGFWLSQLRDMFDSKDVVAESRDTVFELLMDFNHDLVVYHVAGDLNNIKVTMPVDRAIATAILAQQKSICAEAVTGGTAQSDSAAANMSVVSE